MKTAASRTSRRHVDGVNGSTEPHAIGHGRSKQGALYYQVRIHTGGEWKNKVLAASDLNSDVVLGELGIHTSGMRAHLRRTAEQVAKNEESIKVVDEPGLGGDVFVLPNGRVFPQGRPAIAVRLPGDVRGLGRRYRRGGDLTSWKRLAQLAAGNDALMLALSLSISGPIAAFLKVEAPAFQLVGPAGCGKTSIAIAAGSIYGRDFINSFNHTTASLESFVAGTNATLAILDETARPVEHKYTPNTRATYPSSTLW